MKLTDTIIEILMFGPVSGGGRGQVSGQAPHLPGQHRHLRAAPTPHPLDQHQAQGGQLSQEDASQATHYYRRPEFQNS